MRASNGLPSPYRGRVLYGSRVECAAVTHIRSLMQPDARPAKVRAGDPRPRRDGVLKHSEAGCACGWLIVVKAPAERRIGELQGRYMNDVAEEQETVVFGVEGVAGMTGSMTRQRNCPQPLGHMFAIPYGSQQGPELRKVRLSAKALHGRLGYHDYLQVRKSTRPSRVRSPFK
jgi:hypothetical protein